MANKRFWLGMLVMVLVFGMTVVGCDIPEEEDRIIGRWVNWGRTVGLTFYSDGSMFVKITGYVEQNYSYELNGKILKITDKEGNSATGIVRFETVDKTTKLRISDLDRSGGITFGGLGYMNDTYTRNE